MSPPPPQMTPTPLTCDLRCTAMVAEKYLGLWGQISVCWFFSPVVECEESNTRRWQSLEQTSSLESSTSKIQILLLSECCSLLSVRKTRGSSCFVWWCQTTFTPEWSSLRTRQFVITFKRIFKGDFCPNLHVRGRIRREKLLFFSSLCRTPFSARTISTAKTANLLQIQINLFRDHGAQGAPLAPRTKTLVSEVQNFAMEAFGCSGSKLTKETSRCDLGRMPRLFLVLSSKFESVSKQIWWNTWRFNRKTFPRFVSCFSMTDEKSFKWHWDSSYFHWQQKYLMGMIFLLFCQHSFWGIIQHSYNPHVLREFTFFG